MATDKSACEQPEGGSIFRGVASQTMMDTTNSFANSKCKPRMHFKIKGTSKAMKGAKTPEKGPRTAPESDGSSSSSEGSSSKSDNGMKVIPRTSNHSLRGSHHSHRSSSSNSSKRSSLKKRSARAPPPEADLSDSEGYGDIMKDYCYNENNVLVPKIKLETAATPTIGVNDDDDDASVGSSRSSRRLRRAGRRPNGNGDDEGFQVIESSAGQKKALQRRGEDVAFWDHDTDSSDDEGIFKLNPPKSQPAGKEKSPPSNHRFSMQAAPRRASTATSRENASVDSTDYFTAQEAPPERRTPGRADSGWHTGGSFESSDEDEPAEKAAAPKVSLSKLSQAALRMSRLDKTSPSFTFAKKNCRMDGYASKPKIADPIGLGDDDDDDEDLAEERDGSNHSEASKTTASFVSAGGWSTGKDSSSSEDERKRKPVATKKIASKKESKKAISDKNSKPTKHTITESSVDDIDPFAPIHDPKGDRGPVNISSHSADSKFSFISANSGSMESGSSFSNESDPVSPITCSVGVADLKDMPEEMKLESLDEDHDGSFVFDLSAMEFDTDGIFEDGPDTTQGRNQKGVKNSGLESKSAEDLKADKPSQRTAKKSKKEKDSTKKLSDRKDKEKLKRGSDHKKGEKKEKPKSSDKLKKEKGCLKQSEHTEKEKAKQSSKAKKMKASDEKNVGTQEPKKEAKISEGKKEVTSVQEKLLEKRRQERAARLEKAKERIRQQEQESKNEATNERKMKSTMELSPKKRLNTEYDRRERAYQWYTRCGMLTKEKLKSRIKTIPHCDITNDDIDLLPWMTGGRIVNVAKMMQYAREK